MLKVFCFVVGYRFHNFMRPKLRIPYKNSLTAKEIREKARASTAVVGFFLAFLVTLLAVLATGEGKDAIEKIKPVDWTLLIAGLIGAVLPYLVLRAERKISAAQWEAQAWAERKRKTDDERKGRQKNLRILHYALLAFWLLAYFSYFLCAPWQQILARGLGLSGLALVGSSLALLVFSVELYDTAGSWQRLDETEYHFHVASLASHCYLLGLSTTLVGFSLLLCLAHLRTGYWLSVAVIILLIALTEIERTLYLAD